MPSPNRIQRRSDLLAQAIQDRVGHTYRQLTEPEPAFQVRVNEDDQLRIYEERLANGELARMRRSGGGPFSDEDMDRYVASMERKLGRQSMQEPEF